MNKNELALIQSDESSEETFDYEELEKIFESELEEDFSDLGLLEEDRKKIGNPDSIGETVMNVVWEQFINQVGVIAGEDFIKENRGLTLDLSNDAHIITIKNYGKEGVGSHNYIINSEKFIKNNHNQTLNLSNDAHIQTTGNFANGIIASHNQEIDYQHRYNDWQGNFQRNDDNSIKIKYDRIDGEEQAILRNNRGKSGTSYNHNFNAREYIDNGRPKGSASMHKDHTISAAEIIRDPEANAHLSREEQASFANSNVNLMDLDASANGSKNDHRMKPWLNSERNGQKPGERFNIDENELIERDTKAREAYKQLKEEGEKKSKESGLKSQKEEEARSIEAGKQSQKEEAIRIGGKALRSIVMGLFTSFIKDIIRKLIVWFRKGKRKLSTFIDSIKEAIKLFVSDIKKHLLNAANTLVTTIATAIYGPVIGMIKKAWIFLKQGYRSLKDAIQYIKDKKNRNKPFSILMLEVGKIVIAGLTAGGAIVLSEVIEKSLLAIPFFAFHIPLLGSLASILGIFLGALVSGIIGAIALNLIDKAVANKQKRLNTSQQISKKNTIIQKQHILINVTKENHKQNKQSVLHEMNERHELAGDVMQESLSTIKMNQSSASELKVINSNNIDQILSDLSQEL